MQDAKLGWYITTLVNTQFRPATSPLVNDALERIGRTALISHAQALQLLALRRYLRIQNRDQGDLAAIWPWTPEQVNANLNTPSAARRLMDEASRVQQAFAAANPGHTLGLSPPRDLDRQVTLWNGSLDARTAALDLLKRTLNEMAKPLYDLPAPLTTIAAFARWLEQRGVNPEPGNAAPGTSDHGQLRAVDFVVMRAGRVIAGTQRATIASQWTAAGWTARLAAATAGTQLVGPLANPYEPWHWTLR